MIKYQMYSVFSYNFIPKVVFLNILIHKKLTASLAQFINILPFVLSATTDQLHTMNSLPWTFHACSHIRGLGDRQEMQRTHWGPKSHLQVPNVEDWFSLHTPSFRSPDRARSAKKFLHCSAAKRASLLFVLHHSWSWHQKGIETLPYTADPKDLVNKP